MVALNTPVCNFGWKPPEFGLSDFKGTYFTLEDIRGRRGTLLIFMCNHCPYVKALVGGLVRDARILQDQGVGVAAVMPNDVEAYPDDAPEHMASFAKQHGFSFPYLYDSTQVVARGFGAVCTPDFFGFNAELELQYRGRFDSSLEDPSREPRRDLLEAFEKILETGQGPKEQIPSMGCSIKWRPGRRPGLRPGFQLGLLRLRVPEFVSRFIPGFVPGRFGGGRQKTGRAPKTSEPTSGADLCPPPRLDNRSLCGRGRQWGSCGSFDGSNPGRSNRLTPSRRPG